MRALFVVTCAIVVTAVVVGCTKPEIGGDGNKGHKSATREASPPADAKPAATGSKGAPVVARVGLALPCSKDEVLAALKARGFVMGLDETKPDTLGITAYRTKDVAASLSFQEDEGKLDSIILLTDENSPTTTQDQATKLAEIVAGTAAKLSPEDAYQAIAQALQPRGTSRNAGLPTPGVSISGSRLPDGILMFMFTPRAR